MESWKINCLFGRLESAAEIRKNYDRTRRRRGREWQTRRAEKYDRAAAVLLILVWNHDNFQLVCYRGRVGSEKSGKKINANALGRTRVRKTKQTNGNRPSCVKTSYRVVFKCTTTCTETCPNVVRFTFFSPPPYPTIRRIGKFDDPMRPTCDSCRIVSLPIFSTRTYVVVVFDRVLAPREIS